METISSSDTGAANTSRFTRQTASSHSTWQRLNGSCSPSFDQPSGTENPSAVQNASTIFQRRRVNPESLALRLGPDLVRDLEALIHPGNIEMPSFAVRKELQERYNIDRRHVYDYFHSRGLRVIKEDKNGNTTVPNDFAPVPARSPNSNLNSRTLRQVSVKESQRATLNLISKLKEAKPSISKPRGVTKAKPGRPRKYAVKSTRDDPLPPVAICPSSRAISPILQPDISPTSDTDNDHEFDMAVTGTIDESYSFSQAIEEVAYTYRGPPVLMFETSPLHTLSQGVPDLRTDPEAEQGLSPRKEFADPLSSNVCTLSATERVAVYQLLSGAFGNTCDIQECAGTYRKYMQERSQVYYEGLLAVPYQNSRYNDRRLASCDNRQSVSCNGSEYRRWVKPGEFCIMDDKASMKVKADTNTMRQKAQVDSDNEAHPLDTLFDLNWTNVDDSIGESPVIRSRRQSYVPLDFYFLPNEERGEAEDLLLDGASNSVTPELPNHSVSIQSKIRGGSLHGHPDFPGSPPLLPSADFHHVDVNPRPALPLQQPASSAFTLVEQKSNRKGLAPQTRFALRTPQKHLCEYDRIRTRSFTSRSARMRTTSAGGGI